FAGQSTSLSLNVNADIDEGRTVNVLLVLPREYLRDAVASRLAVESEPRAGQADLRTGRDGVIAALDIGMLHRQLGDHLADDVVQIRTMRDVFELRLLLFAQRLPVVGAHVLRVGEGPGTTPDLARQL